MKEARPLHAASTLRLLATLVVALLASRGCAGDDIGHESTLVGGPCQHHPDCEDRCVEGGDFPGGTCTVDCDHDEDCPAGTRCVDRAGGICLLACEHDPDCRGAYDCRRIDREGHPGEISVCIN